MIGAGTILAVLAALVFPGIVSITKAKMSGRKGPGVFQPLADAIRSLKKGSIYSTTTTAIFQVAPVIYLASVAMALLFIPFNGEAGIFSFNGDFVFVAYLLAFGKFLMIISAMDTGSGFEGMGANREALYSMLVEPTFFIMMGSFALLTDHVSFVGLFTDLHYGTPLTDLLVALSIYLLIKIMMVENSRMPVDDPKTHLELTMVHEVMVLDNSGFDLGITQITSALKFTFYGALIAELILPSGGSIGLNALLFILLEIGLAVVVGLLESFNARLKMQKNPQWIVSLATFALVGFFTALLISQKFILN